MTKSKKFKNDYEENFLRMVNIQKKNKMERKYTKKLYYKAKKKISNLKEVKANIKSSKFTLQEYF